MTLTTGNEAPAADAALVRLSDLFRELGLPQGVRRKLTEQELVTPVRPVRQGRPTYIRAEDAERVRRGVLIATATGLALNIVLKVLRAL